MRSEDIFAMGLGLLPPWEVKSVSFEDAADGKELHIHIDFNRGSRFLNDKGEQVSAYDTEEKRMAPSQLFRAQVLSPLTSSEDPHVRRQGQNGGCAVDTPRKRLYPFV